MADTGREPAPLVPAPIADERWQPGMPALDRQPVPAGVAVGPAGGLRSVPETRPTPLQRNFVLVSAPALVAGAVGITALETGAGFGSWLVKLCAIIAAPLLLLTTLDATVRIWRSAWAWMPVDRGRGLFRLSWVLVSLVFLGLVVLAAALVLGA
jgi:hypothetical protein